MKDNFTKPLDSLNSTLAVDARDWSMVYRDAWIYGIICGWENEDPLDGETEDDAINEICKKHGFDKSRMKSLRKVFQKFEKLEDLGSCILWKEFHLFNNETYPKKAGKYLVRRKDGKTHFEKYNGTGWAYNNNNITHWCEVNQPL